MKRRIRIAIGDVAAVAELYDDLSPRMAEAFWQSLPLELPLVPEMWSGLACSFAPATPSLAEVTELEHPVCTVYPGVIAARPGGSVMLLAYGSTEFRWELGVDYMTPVAKTVENRPALLAALAQMHSEGEKTLIVDREG